MVADGVLYVFCWRMQQRRGVGAYVAPIRRCTHRPQLYSATARTMRRSSGLPSIYVVWSDYLGLSCYFSAPMPTAIAH